MPNIVHRIGIDGAKKEALFDAISTRAGLASWWTTKVEGESTAGGSLKFLFDGGGPEFEVLEIIPDHRVEWRCVMGPKEWIDTHISFQIKEEEGEAVLLFKHGGWREENEFMHHCSTQWAYFLIGLRKLLEGGQATPFGGRFEPISRWSR
jgi:uncharacterized protein YndB with AHSA1/START domain